MLKIKEWNLTKNYNPRIEHFVLPTYEPDMKWVYVDKEGHVHSYSPDGEVETLKFVVDSKESYWCDDCGDEHENIESHRECIFCGEHIEPEVIMISGGEILVDGPIEYSGTIVVENELEPNEKHTYDVELLMNDKIAYYGTIRITSEKRNEDCKWEYEFRSMKMERDLDV